MLDFLFTAIDDQVINFQTLEMTEKSNQYLVLPEGQYKAEPHEISPALKVSAEDLKKYFVEVAERQEKVELIRTSADGKQLDFVQRTPLMGYPDTITVRFIGQDSDTSTLAIYSRSSYGYSDLGANAERVKEWLEQLQKSLPAQ